MNNEELDHIIEKSFRTEPEYFLPENFIGKVIFAIEKRGQWKSNLIEYLNILGITTALLLVVGGFYYYINAKLTLEILSYISENIIQFILLGLLLNFIVFADRVLLRMLFKKWDRT